MKRTLKGAGSISAVLSGINLFGLNDPGGRPSRPLVAKPLCSAEVSVNQQTGEAPSRSNEAARPASALGRAVRFGIRHPVGVAQAVFFALVAIVILQNLESTSIDVLFWSFPAFPKIVLIFLSMLVGAALWELVRRLLRR